MGWFQSVVVLRGVCGFRQAWGDDDGSTLPQKLLRRGEQETIFPRPFPVAPTRAAGRGGVVVPSPC